MNPALEMIDCQGMTGRITPKYCLVVQKRPSLRSLVGTIKSGRKGWGRTAEEPRPELCDESCPHFDKSNIQAADKLSPKIWLEVIEKYIAESGMKRYEFCVNVIGVTKSGVDRFFKIGQLPNEKNRAIILEYVRKRNPQDYLRMIGDAQ